MSNGTFDNPSPHESQNAKEPKSSAAAGRAESADEPVGMLGEEYLVSKVIRGGMGEVYICEPVSERGEATQAGGGPEGAPQKKRRVALKTFQKRLFFDRASRLAFLREVSIWSRLSGQPHIMPLIGLQVIDGRPFVVMMEVKPGPYGETTVRDLVNVGPFLPERALQIAFQIALGLRSASLRVPGIIHGDLKPENLLLINQTVYITDFGLALAVAEEHPEVQLQSTWAYQAPELWGARCAPSPVADVYSFGVMLYEFLTGRSPFVEFTQEGWAAAHREARPVPPEGYPREDLAVGLMEVALACLAKNPEERPQDFGQLMHRLQQLSEEHDFLGGFMMMYESANHKAVLESMAKEMRPQIIRTLLNLDENELALREVEDIPAEDYEGDLWALRGTVLSLNNKDEEAISSFEKALGSDLGKEGRESCLSEYALSLKRVGRYDEAIEIYNDLIPSVSDERLPMVVTNLATVYYMRGEPHRMVETLAPFVRQHPDEPRAWASLGLGHQGVKEYRKAAECFQRALSLSPSNTQVQILFANVCMDHLGRIEDASAALEAAYDQGHTSRDWFVRFFVCNLFLNQQEKCAALSEAARRDATDEDELAHLQEEVAAMAQRIDATLRELMNKEGGVAAGEGIPPEPEEADVPADACPSKERGSKPAGTEPPSGPSEEVASLPGEAPAPDDSEQHAFSMPFINYRFFNMEDFTLDFYYDTAADDYVERFFREWRNSMRNPHMKFGDGLRSTPFYFTECPGCGLSILTNRDHGKGLRCRACETYHHTASVQREALGGLLDQIKERLGANALLLSQPVHVLFVQLLDEKRLPEADEICRGAGFKQLQANHPMRLDMFMEGRKRNCVVSDKAYTVWERAAGFQELSWREATPREVNEVVRRIRMLGSDVVTLSMTYDASDESRLGLFRQGRHEEIEEILRKDLAEDLGNVGALLELIEVLIYQGKFEEARDKALAATLLSPDDPKTWLALARSEMRLDNFEKARDAFEESLTMDPTNSRALMFLAFCYDRLGDGAKAASMRRRGESLGGLSGL